MVKQVGKRLFLIVSLFLLIVMEIAMLPSSNTHAAILQMQSATGNDLKSSYDLPSWWHSQDCDTLNYPIAKMLKDENGNPAKWRGIEACGPKPGTGLGVKTKDFPGSTEYEWQCTELVKRYLNLAWGLPGKNNTSGKDIVDIYSDKNNYPNTPFFKVPNDGTVKMAPIEGDVLSSGDRNNSQDNGHTAIVVPNLQGVKVVDVNGDGFIRIFEQNWDTTNNNAFRTIEVKKWIVTGFSSWMTTRTPPGGWWDGQTPDDGKPHSATGTVSFHAASNGTVSGVAHVNIGMWKQSTNQWQTIVSQDVINGQEVTYKFNLDGPTIFSSTTTNHLGFKQEAPNGMRHVCYNGCPPSSVIAWNDDGPSVGGGGSGSGSPPPSPTDGVKICSGANSNGTCNVFTYTSNDGSVQALGPLSHNQDSVQFLGSYANSYDVVLCLKDGCPSSDRQVFHDDPNFASSITQNQYVALRIVKLTAPPPSPSDGVQVFQNGNYSGPSQTFTYDGNNGTCYTFNSDLYKHQDSIKFLGSYIGQFDAVFSAKTDCSTGDNEIFSDKNDFGLAKNQYATIRLVTLHPHTPPNAPDSPTPADGTTLPIGTTTLNMSWNGSDSSVIHIWSDSGWDYQNDWSGNGIGFGNLGNGTYHWQAKTSNAYGESPWSSTWTFIIPKAGPPVPLPSGSVKEGGLNLAAYCQSINQPVSGVINQVWYCGNGTVILDLTKSCQWQYSNTSSFSFQEEANNPYTWNCYAPPKTAPVGSWQTPQNGFFIPLNGTIDLTANIPHLDTNYYINYIDFRANWNGSWVDICPNTGGSDATGLYSCTFDTATYNIPPNTQIRIAFDEYDISGSLVLPTQDGERVGIYGPPAAGTLSSPQTNFSLQKQDAVHFAAHITGQSVFTISFRVTFNGKKYYLSQDSPNSTSDYTLDLDNLQFLGIPDNTQILLGVDALDQQGNIIYSSDDRVGRYAAAQANPVSPGNNAILPVGTTATDLKWTGDGPFLIIVTTSNSSAAYVMQKGYIGNTYHITGLQPGITYTWNAYGDNQVYSASMNFTAAKPAPKVFDTFTNGTSGWVLTNSVAAAKDGTNGILRFTNPSKPATAAKTVNAATLAPFNTITIRMNLHGATLPSGSSAQIFLDQSGITYVPLSTYVKQKVNGWQIITIPISAFKGFTNTKSFARFGISMTTGTKMMIDFDDITFLYR